MFMAASRYYTIQVVILEDMEQRPDADLANDIIFLSDISCNPALIVKVCFRNMTGLFSFQNMAFSAESVDFNSWAPMADKIAKPRQRLEWFEFEI